MTEAKQKRRIRMVIAGLILALLLFVFLNLCLGSVMISPASLPELLFGGKTNATDSRILWELRLPRTLMAMILGGALALSGLMLQIFFENPIAGPFVLGISSGAKLVVALMLILSLKTGWTLSSFGMVGAAFLGSVLVIFFLLLISRKLPGGATLLVAGIMIGYICTAVTDLLINLAEDENVVSLHNWSMGSFSGVRWEQVGIAAGIVFPLFVVALFLAKPMQAFFLGETVAGSLGVNIRRFRVILVSTASLLAAAVTAFAGPVSFVGIAVPFLMRSLLNTEQTRITVPVTFMGGAVFCLLADLLARCVLMPTELSISVITSILGAPVVILMLIRRRRGSHGR